MTSPRGHSPDDPSDLVGHGEGDEPAVPAPYQTSDPGRPGRGVRASPADHRCCAHDLKLAQMWRRVERARPAGRKESGRWLNKRAANSHLTIRGRERAVARFRLRKFSSVPASVHNQFSQDSNGVSREIYKERRLTALAGRRAVIPSTAVAHGRTAPQRRHVCVGLSSPIVAVLAEQDASDCRSAHRRPAREHGIRLSHPVRPIFDQRLR